VPGASRLDDAHHPLYMTHDSKCIPFVLCLQSVQFLFFLVEPTNRSKHQSNRPCLPVTCYNK
jgi:hypothetical protein